VADHAYALGLAASLGTFLEPHHSQSMKSNCKLSDKLMPNPGSDLMGAPKSRGSGNLFRLFSEIQVATTNAGARTARRLDPRLFGALLDGVHVPCNLAAVLRDLRRIKALNMLDLGMKVVLRAAAAKEKLNSGK
jgi:hypothetical protein